MVLIGIDTSGDACSVALLCDGELDQRLEMAPRRHTELVLDMLRDLLETHDLILDQVAAVAFAQGPGSFTGVRIAVSLAQGLAFSAGLATIPVSTLAAIAEAESRRTGERRLLVALDARMGEVYWGAFEVRAAGLLEPVGEAVVCPPESVPIPPGGDWWGAGSGWANYHDALTGHLSGAGRRISGVNPEAICEAGAIVRLAAGELAAGRTLAPELARPVYLRDRVTHRTG